MRLIDCFCAIANCCVCDQAHWGWDWGAGFLTSGIYRELSLLSYRDTSVLRDVVVQVFQTSVTAASAADENPTSAVRPAPTSFRVDLDVFLISAASSRTTISAAIPSLGVNNVTDVSVAAGEQKVRVSLWAPGWGGEREEGGESTKKRFPVPEKKSLHEMHPLKRGAQYHVICRARFI